MKLHHTVNHIPSEWRVASIISNGLIPQVADEYKDLVPEEIRHLPVVWFAEGIWQGWDLPVFEVDSKDLNSNKLYKVLTNPNWWVYQGEIPLEYIEQLVEG